MVADAYVFRGEDFAGVFGELTVTKVDGSVIYIAEDLSAQLASKIAEKRVWIDNRSYTITSATAGENGTAYLTMSEDLTDKMIAPDMKIYPGEGGVNGTPVYSTVIIGKNAFGTAGDNSVEMINKSLGSAGTSDPLNQRGTVGWKSYRFFKILEQTKMLRIESVANLD